MTALFQRILSMSLSASWVILAVIAARFLLKRAPKWVICSLWALVALRLICPVSIESPFSLVPRQETVLEEVTAYVPFPAEPEPMDHALAETRSVYQEPAAAAYDAAPVPEPSSSEVKSRQANWLAVSTIVWLTGAGILASYALISCLRIRQTIGACIDLGNGVFLCDYIDTPFILGAIRPKIYLPSAMEPKDAAHVLAHERAHLTRRDHWWKPLGFSLLALHWFNPLMWLAYVLLCRDIELACDEKVIKELAEPEKKSYSEALLKCSIKRNAIAACPLAFGEVGVKQRIRSIVYYKKPGFWILLTSLLAVLALALCFLTDPRPNNLANILNIRKDVVCIDVWGRKGTLHYEGEEALAQVTELMDSLEYDPTPAQDSPIPGNSDENKWSYYLFKINYEEETEYILSDYHHQLVWTRDAQGNTSLPYRLKNPEVLNQFLSDHATPIRNRRVETQQQGATDAPADWLRHILPRHISTARAYIITNAQRIEGGYLSNAQLSQAISVLNAMPTSALTAAEEIPNFTYDDLRYFSTNPNAPYTPTGISLVLEDKDWNLSAIVRLYEHTLELVLLQDFTWEGNAADTQPGHGWLWKAESPELESYLASLIQEPPSIQTFLGARYDFLQETLYLTDGSHTLQTPLLQYWDYEIVSPGEGEGTFGFRCRPQEETEGWVYFGWYGNTFSPPSQGEYWIKNRSYQNCNQDTGSTKYYIAPQPNTWSKERYLQGEYMPWIYQRHACEHGDFLVINDGADAWIEEYEETLDDIRTFITQTGEETTPQG